MKSILVPIDFSATSRKALKYAIDLAHGFGARITLLHVVIPLPYPVDMSWDPSGLNMALGPVRKQLTALADELIPSDLRGDEVVEMGAPYEAIADHARRQKVDLIVIGTHGRSDFGHILMGSTAERVVRHAPCPVLVVRRQPGDESQG